MPFVFTEHGVLMLSSVLNSQRAIDVNIRIVRVYTKLKELLMTNKDLLLKMQELENRITNQDENIQMIFDYLKQFIHQQNEPRKRIGF